MSYVFLLFTFTCKVIRIKFKKDYMAKTKKWTEKTTTMYNVLICQYPFFIEQPIYYFLRNTIYMSFLKNTNEKLKKEA